MKIMTDTNILFSALLFPESRPARAVLCCGVDINISGDKHFLELKMEHPKTMTAAEFLDGGI